MPSCFEKIYVQYKNTYKVLNRILLVRQALSTQDHLSKVKQSQHVHRIIEFIVNITITSSNNNKAY